MTPDQLAAAEAFARGPLDGYTVHAAQAAVAALLAERERHRMMLLEAANELERQRRAREAAETTIYELRQIELACLEAENEQLRGTPSASS